MISSAKCSALCSGRYPRVSFLAAAANKCRVDQGIDQYRQLIEEWNQEKQRSFLFVRSELRREDPAEEHEPHPRNDESRKQGIKRAQLEVLIDEKVEAEDEQYLDDDLNENDSVQDAVVVAQKLFCFCFPGVAVGEFDQLGSGEVQEQKVYVREKHRGHAGQHDGCTKGPKGHPDSQACAG